MADAGVFDARDNAIGTDADKGNDRWSQAFYFGFESLAARTKFVVGEFIGAGGGARDDVRDPEFKVEKEITFKRREETRRKTAAVQCRPKTVAGTAEVPADGGGVEAGVDARK